MTARQFFFFIRPHTLPASAAPIIAATAWATAQSSINWMLAGLTLLTGLLAQLTCNVANDYYDFLQGADRPENTGYERMLATGRVSLTTVRTILIVFFFLTALVGSAVVLLSGHYWLFVLGALILIGSIAYSTGPLAFAYHGLGEVAVFLFFGLVAVLGTYYVLRERLDIEAWGIAVAMGLLNCNVLIVNNYRDWADDKATNKNTLAVRFGRGLMPILYTANYLIAAVALFPLLLSNRLLLLLLIPFLSYMLQASRRMRALEGTELNKVLSETVIGGVVFVCLIVVLVSYVMGRSSCPFSYISV